MDHREKQLEQVVNSLKEFEPPKAPPVFELFAALLAISLGIMLLLIPDALNQASSFWVLMSKTMPYGGWVCVLFLGGVMSALGMLLDNNLLRIVGLVILAMVYGLLAAFYIVNFPNFGGVLMFWIAVFTVSSIPLIKYTGIRH